MCDNIKPAAFSQIGFGAGIPKICVPLTAVSLPQLKEEAGLAASLPADLYEFRADHYQEDLPQALACLHELLPRPILLTIRTRGQGGEIELSPEEYEERLLALIAAEGGHSFQLVDIELACGDGRAAKLVNAAHEHGLVAVVSEHDFHNTPPREQMLDTLRKMKSLGADLPKLAVMPNTPEDVLSLLETTLSASRELGPVVTMSMGPLGRISRLSGELTGSAMTFAAGARPSAPGQLEAGVLLDILKNLH